MKKRICTVLAAALMLTTSAFADGGNTSDYDFSLKYNFTLRCVANEEVKVSDDSFRTFIEYFTITDNDFSQDKLLGLYLVGDFDEGLLTLVVANRETGDIVEIVGESEEAVFPDDAESRVGQVTKYRYSDTGATLNTYYNTVFELVIDDLVLLLDTSLNLQFQVSFEPESPDPTLKLNSSSLIGEGFTGKFIGDPLFDSFVISSGLIKAAGTTDIEFLPSVIVD